MSLPRILVLGGGGREHALCWHLSKFSRISCAPGSDGIAESFETWAFNDFAQLASQIKSKKIETVVVGPEKYLAEGVVDFLEKEGVFAFGPTQKAAALESDKAWAKDFCLRHSIPTARSATCCDIASFHREIKKFAPPFVIKASGLAAGKGVWIGENMNEAAKFAAAALSQHSSIVIEEFLRGEEVSFFAMVDGENYILLGGAQDHKRLLENDEGPNTGGMGAYSPVPILNKNLETKIVEKILKPSLAGLKSDKIDYRGFLFLGVMVVANEPYLLEYNCRMGDPETQALMLRLESPLTELIQKLRDSRNLKSQARLSNLVSLNVVVAAKGYPDKPASGFSLAGIENVPEPLRIFHSGTRLDRSDLKNPHWVASGGRLFSVNVLQKTLVDCQQLIYPWIESQKFLKDVTYRRDIAVKAYRHLRGVA